MKRFLSSSLLLLLFFAIPLLGQSKWTPVAEHVSQSVVFIEIFDKDDNPQGSCTGFVIDAEKHHVMTAAHCVGEKMLADGTPTYKLFRDDRKDLMVIRANEIEAPALKLANKAPEIGEEVASMGYGFGLDDPMFRIAHISNVRMDIEGLSGPFAMIDAGFVPGQSGGPVVNDKSEVVMIVQRGNDSLGLGVDALIIKDRAGKYFAKD